MIKEDRIPKDVHGIEEVKGNLKKGDEFITPKLDNPDSEWVSLIHCVPKKGGMTVVANENDELIATRTVTGWRVYKDYSKLNEATRKDHYSLPFMDQMLERLAGNKKMPFVLCNAPTTFQRCMTAIFQDMLEK
uniref:uncharacterized protein LOC122608915 n=1 Tax=Erigeron canadensis TaxID=72917 RepID=UPI001CB8A586|nr:uncharacterized protein LOC122608915 [Erigeron canadensis]